MRRSWIALRSPTLILIVMVLFVTLLAGCGTSTSGAAADGKVTLTLVAYSTPREAYEAVIKAFQQTPQGRDVDFRTSFGGSGEQSRAVESGLEADVVAFSLEPDMTRLVDAKMVEDDWKQGAERGMVTDSVVVLVVRDGNPKQIRGWDDLIRPGIEVITPSPLTSGGAKWNIMAAYGAQLRQGKTPEQAIDYLRALMSHVPVQDKSAREALQTFANGKGDVMIAYENEAILARREGQKLDYVVPDQTILIENPVAVVSRSEHPEQANAFVQFLRSPQAQRIFAEQGYRPILPDVLATSKFPKPAELFTIADLGGWPEINERFFDPNSGIISKIEQEKGDSP